MPKWNTDYQWFKDLNNKFLLQNPNKIKMSMYSNNNSSHHEAINCTTKIQNSTHQNTSTIENDIKKISIEPLFYKLAYYIKFAH